jgi:HlyD family secretion protein
LKAIAVAVLTVAVVVAGVSAVRGTATSASAEERASSLTTQVVRGSIEETVGATGTVAGTQRATLSFLSSGPVAEVAVEEGQAVQEGQILARLDTGTVEQHIERAEASLETAQARLAQAEVGPSEAEIAAAEAALKTAEDNLERLVAGPTQSDLKAAKLNVDAARNQLWSAQAQRDATKGSPMSSQAQIDSAEAQVLSAEVAVEQALLNQRRLSDPPTEAELAAAQSQVAQARSQLEQVLDRPRDEDVAVAQAQVEEAALALAQAQESLEDLQIVAPFEGTVVSVTVVEGELASLGAPAIVIADTQHLVVEALVDEHDVAQIHVGGETRLSFEALPKEEVIGTVSWIASAATQAGGGVAYAVDVAFDPGDLPVRIGMTSDVEIVAAAVEDALLVPNRAVTADREAGRYFVTQLDASGREEVVEVSVGLISETYTEVTSGLREGDVVALAQITGGNDAAQSELPFGGTGIGLMSGGQLGGGE